MPRSIRYEFPKSVQRAADKRAAGRCEATGAVYGLEPGQRCNAPFKGGRKERDHYPLPATEEGSDVLENCVVCCPLCHGYKTRTFDIPVQAKTKRVSDKHNGIRQPSRLSGPGFSKVAPQHTATAPLSDKFSNLRKV